MIKHIVKIVTLSFLVLSLNAQEFGSIDGQIRFYNIFSSAYVKSGQSEDYSIDGSTIGGHLRLHSLEYYGFGVTTAVYYAVGTGLNDKDDPNTIMAAGRFFTSDYSFKAILGELNLYYKDDNHYGIIGHFKIDSPLTNSISTYMPNMFEAVLYTNNYFDSTSITLGHIEKMAYATRTPVEFGLIGETTMTAGATQNGLETRGKFIDIEKQILADDDVSTDGITFFAIENKSLENLRIRTWNFYAYDIMNMFYLDCDFKDKFKYSTYTLSAQYLRVDGIGDDLAEHFMDLSSAYLMGLKVSIEYKKSLFYLAYNHSGNAKILNPWGGDPAYTSTIFTRNAYRANVDAYKLGFNYNILKNLKFMSSYADYGQSTTLGTFSPSKPVEVASLPRGDASEYNILLSYNPIKELNILAAIIYRESEYFYEDKQVELLDIDLVVTYSF